MSASLVPLICSTQAASGERFLSRASWLQRSLLVPVALPLALEAYARAPPLTPPAEPPPPLLAPVARPAAAHSLQGGGAGGEAPPLKPPLTNDEQADLGFHDLAHQWMQEASSSDSRVSVLAHRCWGGATARAPAASSTPTPKPPP